jgi:streptogramin lyase
MVDISVDMDNNVFVLVLLGEMGDAGGGEAIYRIDNDMEISKIVKIRGGRDPKSIDVDSDGNIWFSTTVGVFRATPSE